MRPARPFARTRWLSWGSARPASGRRGLALAACALAVTATAACGSADTAGSDAPATTSARDSSTPTPSGSGRPTSNQAVITITDFAFHTPASVPAGATIAVKNDDNMAHTVTASRSGTFDVTIKAHATATITAPNKPGKYPFVCQFHGNMKPTLTVT